jgi:hypothetical protein
MLREGLAAPGRIWLLLRHLDGEGQGWIRLDVIRQELTHKESAMRVCGRRQLRNLLRQGKGIFWEREKGSPADGRLWLKSAAKVAAALGVERLRGRPVSLPLKVLLGGIGQVRAHLYASFHSGRHKSGPISRAKLEQISHVPGRTQRAYDQAAGVVRRRNIAIGEGYKPKYIQERAWRHGRGTFQYVDYNGHFGPEGGRYVAWRLPNSYEGPHDPSPRGRQKKINHQIDLVNIGAQGNDLGRGEPRQKVDRLFHASGLEAGKAYNRDGTADIYWPRRGGYKTRPGLWHVIPAQEWPEKTCHY